MTKENNKENSVVEEVEETSSDEEISMEDISIVKDSVAHSDADSGVDDSSLLGTQSKKFAFEKKDIPFSQVQLLPSFRNSRRRPGDLTGLMASLMDMGLQSPLTVWGQPCPPITISDKVVTEQFFLIAGFRRFDAIQHLNSEYPGMFDMVPVHVFRGTHEEAANINLTENIQREDLSPYEVGLHIVYMTKTFKISQQELADRLGKTQSYVSFLSKIGKGEGIHKDLLELIESNRLNIWAAQEWVYKSLDEQEAFVKRYIDSLDAQSDGKGKDKSEKDKKEKKPPKRRKIRSIQELQERMDAYSKTDFSKLNDIQRSHISGILKALFWSLNNEVEWKPIELDKWGFEYKPLDED